MSKLFISYRRKSWPFTHRLADELRKRLDTDIFVDYTGVDEPDFEKSILRHLRESSAMLLVVSEHTFILDRITRPEDWVRREVREALSRHIPVVLVCVEGLLPPLGLPDDIKDVVRSQGINFYPDYFTPAVDNLAQFIVRIGAARYKPAEVGAAAVSMSTSVPAAPPAPEPITLPADKTIAGKSTLDDALELLDNRDYSKAVFLLEQLRANGYKSRVFDLDMIIADARSHQEKAERRYSAQVEYDEIVSLAARNFTVARARDAFERWYAEYGEFIGELDTAGLNERFKIVQPVERAEHPDHAEPVQPKAVEHPVSLDVLPRPFAWISIPAGRVTLVTWTERAPKYIAKGSSHTYDVGIFSLAKYPITNAQYARFIEAGGYETRKWWTDEGWQVRESGGWTEPAFWHDYKYSEENLPVVGVSWYEAAAFCQWLSEVTQETIVLPTEQQWQRAAQGDTSRSYAWGDTLDETRCNSSVRSRSAGTTVVNKYEGKGNSAFGVVDMTGNVWEWCLTDYRGKTELTGRAARMARGGGWGGGSSVRLRVDYRLTLQPDVRNFDVGFRAACV